MDRKAEQWEVERQAADRELHRLAHPAPGQGVSAANILELAKVAEFLYQSQNSVEQRRVLETVLSNCNFDRGSLAVTYSKPFDLLVRGNETGEWRAVWDDFRTWLRQSPVPILPELSL